MLIFCGWHHIQIIKPTEANKKSPQKLLILNNLSLTIAMEFWCQMYQSKLLNLDFNLILHFFSEQQAL